MLEFVNVVILNNEIHLSGSRLYGMVLVYGIADSCLYNKQNKQNNTFDISLVRCAY